jgi:hypothetical protein
MPYYSGHATDVVGYAWDADNYCPRCVLELMGVATTGPVHPGPVLESEIDVWAAANGLSHMRETTECPQPIFNSEEAYEEDGRARRCGRCHEPLVETDEETEEEA